MADKKSLTKPVSGRYMQRDSKSGTYTVAPLRKVTPDEGKTAARRAGILSDKGELTRKYK